MITLFIGVQTICVGITSLMAIQSMRVKKAKRQVNLTLVSNRKSGLKVYKPKTNIGGF